MYKSCLRWFSELLTCEIFLLWKESVCISARKFYDRMSLLPEGYVCKPKGQVPYLSTKTEAGGLQWRTAASESGWAYVTLFEEYGSQLFVTVWLNVFQWCTWTQNGLCAHAWPAPRFCSSLSPLSSYPPTSHIVSFRQDRGCLSSVFPLYFPGPVTFIQRFNTDASLSLWSGIQRDGKHNGVPQSLGEEVLLSIRFGVLAGMRKNSRARGRRKWHSRVDVDNVAELCSWKWSEW